MIPGGSIAAEPEAPYSFEAIPEIFIDFENGICTVDGVAADPADLITGYDPADLTDFGLALGFSIDSDDYGTPVPALKARRGGALFRALRNGLLAGCNVIVEYQTRKGVSGSTVVGPMIDWHLATNDPAEGQPVTFGAASVSGLNLRDNVDIVSQSAASNFVGGTSNSGAVQRAGAAIAMKRHEEPFRALRYWGTSLNGSTIAVDDCSYIKWPELAQRIDLFGTPEWFDYASLWYLRKLEVGPQDLNYATRSSFAARTAIAASPLSPASSGLAKDHGGRSEFGFGPFSIGTPASNRLVVAVLVFDTYSGGTAGGATAVDFSGIDGDCVAGNNECEIWQAVVASGTEIEIRPTFATRKNFCSCKVIAFETDEPVPYDAKGGSSSSGANVTLADLAVKNGGKVLAVMKAAAADSGAAWTWGGAESVTQVDFNMIGEFAVSIAEFDPAASATGNDLVCDAPAGAAGNVFVMAVSWPPAAVTDDPYFGSVKLLAGFDGADAATAFTAEETSPHALTFVGNAQLDTAEQRFGSASLLLDGTGDYVSAADSDDWNFGSGAFTVELEAKFAAFSTAQDLIAQYQPTGNQRAWMIQRSASSTFIFWLSTNGTTGTQKITASFSPGTDWNHYRVSFDGTTYRLYANGTQIGSATSPVTLFNSTGLLTLGARGDASEAFNGWLDEVRITKGIARGAGLTRYLRPQAAFPRA
jgi:hypothetical protein